ncbi:alpha/beta hydrolase [Chroogloeocystis siderophila]|uniref:alpha/beta hydrolase n=1 Tax=Chroogloeocystis siderophila TaxID=329163 RepID=UPI000A028576|nr:alpha/beta hydrolase [Chroogloeocystis siderophila]
MIFLVFINFWRIKQQLIRRWLNIPRGIVHLRNVEFTRGQEYQLKMDILHPTKLPKQPMPVIVWIHGGAWREGNKEQGLKRLVAFARQGFFCATIEYRLSHEAIFPAQIEDCKCAIRFLRAHAQQFHLDPQRVGVWGVSAGGHLAALVGTTQDIPELEGHGGWEEYSSSVQAVCDWYGPTDFLKINDFPRKVDFTSEASPEAALIGGVIEANPEKAAKANPITYINPTNPPFFIIHGENDLLVPLNQSQLLFDALTKVGVEASLEIVKGAGHGDQKFDSPILLKKVENFFKNHLFTW